MEIERTGNVQRGVENADDKPERQRDEPQCSIALKGERGRHEQQQNAGNQAGEPPRESECRDRKKRQPDADGTGRRIVRAEEIVRSLVGNVQREQGEQFPRNAEAGGCRGQLP